MTKPVTIAVDAMGGDAAPGIVIKGMARIAKKDASVRFVLYGPEQTLAPMLARQPKLAPAVEIVHTDQIISSDDKPSQALRRGRGSSMGLALQAVKDGKADVAVSAGNTGALMALSILMLRLLPGIKRPALAGRMPTRKGECAMLDLGANVECDEDNLIQFAIMGAAYARIVFGIATPSVGLLNIGVEDMKGNETIKRAAEQLRAQKLPLRFDGFVEADKISYGPVDVVVTDGFTGNVALKAIEGTAKFLADHLRTAFTSSIFARLGFLLVSPGMWRMKRHLDPNNHNGGVLLGLNGLVVKSHGGATNKGFANALDVAIEMARGGLDSLISNDLRHLNKVELTETSQESDGMEGATS